MFEIYEFVDRGPCLPTLSLWLLFVYVEASVRLRGIKTIPFHLDLCRPFAAHWYELFHLKFFSYFICKKNVVFVLLFKCCTQAIVSLTMVCWHAPSPVGGRVLDFDHDLT